MSFIQFLKESEEEKTKFIIGKYDIRKDYMGVNFTPFSKSEIDRAMKLIDKMPRAPENRAWFDTDNELDCRDIGFKWSKQSAIKIFTYGNGRAGGIAEIPIKQIVALQSSIKVEGIVAYLNNKKLNLPVVVQYKGFDEVSVAAGHTRIAAQHLAGRTPKVLVIYDQDEFKRRSGKYNWKQ